MLAAVILACLFFRLPNLESTPSWDWDEGVNLNIAWNLANSQMQNYAITYPFVPHPPLYYAIVGLGLRLFGYDIIVQRMINVLFSVLTAVALYYIGREVAGQRLGLLSGLLYAVYPTAVYWSRIGLGNNLVALLSVTAVYLSLRYVKTRADRVLVYTSVVIGLATITEYMSLSLVAGLLLVLLVNSGEKLVYALVPVFFFLSYVVVMTALLPDAFMYDIMHAKGTSGLELQRPVLGLVFIAVVFLFRKRITVYLTGLWRVVREDLPAYYFLSTLLLLIPYSKQIFLYGLNFYWVGFLGLLLVRDRQIRGVLSAYFIPLVIYVFLVNRLDHMLIPLQPFLALGLGVLMLDVYDRVKSHADSRSLKVFGVMAVLVVYYPVGVTVVQDTSIFIYGSVLDPEPFEDNYHAIEYINNLTTEDDVVATYSYLAQYLTARPTIMLQSAAYDGYGIAYYPSDVPRNRFLYNVSLENVRYIIAWDDLAGWLSSEGQPGLGNYVSNWPSKRFGSRVVYINPMDLDNPSTVEGEPYPENKKQD